MAETRPVLFYDGPCGLCVHSVLWLMRHARKRPERGGLLQFEPLEGEQAAQRLPEELRTPPYDGVVLCDVEGRVHVGVAAVRRLAPFVRFPWSVLLRFAPGWGYRFVAARRSRIAAALPAAPSLPCTLPDPPP